MGILALDVGSTGVTATVVTTDGRIAATGHHELRRHVPQPGWLEHSADEIWQATLAATRDVLRQVDAATLTAIGIANRRDAVVVWDRETLGSPRPVIVGPDRRAADVCERLRSEGHDAAVARLSGRHLDPSHLGTRLAWLAEHEPHTWALVEDGRYAVGTVDSYLVARLTRGTWHVTDVSNASRTLLLELEAGAWSDELCAILGVPRDALPDVVPSWGEVAPCDDRSFLGLSLPIAGIAGDGPAALFGQACFEPGATACTSLDGGWSVLTGTGGSIVRGDGSQVPTATWRSPAGTTTYAVEDTVATTEDLLAAVSAPSPTTLRVGGVAAADDSLCQLLADRLGRPVERPVVADPTALGAAFLAGLGSGVWASTDDLREVWALDRRFEPAG